MIECKSPFENIEGLGCLWLYYFETHTQEEGQQQCQNYGATKFEMIDFDAQYQALFDFLISHGGNNINELNSIKSRLKFHFLI